MTPEAGGGCTDALPVPPASCIIATPPRRALGKGGGAGVEGGGGGAPRAVGVVALGAEGRHLQKLQLCALLNLTFDGCPSSILPCSLRLNNFFAERRKFSEKFSPADAQQDRSGAR